MKIKKKKCCFFCKHFRLVSDYGIDKCAKAHESLICADCGKDCKDFEMKE